MHIWLIFAYSDIDDIEYSDEYIINILFYIVIGTYIEY